MTRGQGVDVYKLVWRTSKGPMIAVWGSRHAFLHVDTDTGISLQVQVYWSVCVPHTYRCICKCTCISVYLYLSSRTDASASVHASECICTQVYTRIHLRGQDTRVYLHLCMSIYISYFWAGNPRKRGSGPGSSRAKSQKENMRNPRSDHLGVHLFDRASM